MVYILTCDVNDHDRRDVEDVENKTFNEVNEVVKYFAPNKVNIYTISEFVDVCNNEEIDVGSIWVTYINIK